MSKVYNNIIILDNMEKKLQYDYFKTGESTKKVIVAIHGWQGDRASMYPIMKIMKINNASWFLLDAPYLVKNGISSVKGGLKVLHDLDYPRKIIEYAEEKLKQ